MKMISQSITGVLGAAMLTSAMASPAEARHRYDNYRRGNGISLGDVVLGTIAVAGVATVVGALGSNRRYDDRRYDRGYDNGRYGNRGYDRSSYGNDRQASVEACAYEAERQAGSRFGGQAQVREIDRVDRSRYDYRVSGTVEVDSRYRYGRDGYGRDGYGRDSYGRGNRGGDQVRFSCSARGTRVTGFSLGSNYAQAY